MRLFPFNSFWKQTLGKELDREGGKRLLTFGVNDIDIDIDSESTVVFPFPTFLFLSRISSLFVNEGSVEEMQEREEG